MLESNSRIERPVIRRPALICGLLAIVVGCGSLVGCRSFYERSIPPFGTTAGGPGIPAVSGIPPIVTDPTSVGPQPMLPPPPGLGSLTQAQLGRVGDGQGTAQLTLAPQSIVAPVGSEVVLLAGIANASGQAATNQRVDWMLSPDSVGQFVTLGDRDSYSLFRFPSNRPRKVDNSFSVGTTTRAQITLDRGTPTPTDDVAVQPGQAWITVSSATDGTSHVTAFAPHVPAWDLRKRNAIIYWVDAQFSFPAPAIAAVGSRQSFTTVVTRSSDGSPLEDFLVRYQVADDGSAGFAPRGIAMIEVPTDAEGRATVELFQRQPQRSEVPITVEVIRPAGVASASDRRLVIGRGATTMTWTAPEVSVRMSGPAEAEVGSTVTYRIELSNSGDLPLNDVVATSRVPSELEYVSSTVTAGGSSSNLEWRIDQLAAGQPQTIDVQYKVAKSGSISNCVSVRAAEGVRAEHCAATNGILPELELNVSGPANAIVGQQVTYVISIRNRSDTALSNLTLVSRFDEGLRHSKPSPMELNLGSLAPGQAVGDIDVTFTVVQEGRLCQTVEIVGDGIQTSRRTVCTVAAAAPAGQSPGALEVQKVAPKTGTVGQPLLFEVIVKNTGGSSLRNVRVVDSYERGLEPSKVSPGYEIDEEKQLTWKFDEIGAGETRRLQVEVQCVEALRSCSRVTVEAAGGVLVADEACVQINAAVEPPPAANDPPPPGGDEPPIVVPSETGDVLSVTLSDIRDEVAVGSKVIYEVTITNLQDVADSNVVLVLTVPDGLTPDPDGVVGPSNPNIAGRVMRFNPVAEIRPAESLTYRIPVRADQAGQFRTQVQVSSDAQRRPLITTEDSSVFREE